MAKYLSEWAAASLSPYIKLETDGEGSSSDQHSHRHSQPQQAAPPSSLSVGLWSGNVELRNVELRPEAFEQWLNPSFHDASATFGTTATNNGGANNSSNNHFFYQNKTRIKWKIIHGSIDLIQIKIPWKKLLVGSSYCSTSVPVSGSPGKKKGKDDAAKDDQNEDGTEGTTEKLDAVGSGGLRRRKDTTFTSATAKAGTRGDTHDQNKFFSRQTSFESQRTKERKGEADQQEEEEEEDPSNSTGFTTVHIQGIKLILGYEIIHDDPFLKTVQNPLLQKYNDSKRKSWNDSTGPEHLEELRHSESLLASRSSTFSEGGDSLHREQSSSSTSTAPSQSQTLLDNDQNNQHSNSPQTQHQRQQQLQNQRRDEKNRILQAAERRLLAGLDPFPPALLSALQSNVQSNLQNSFENSLDRNADSGKGDALGRLDRVDGRKPNVSPPSEDASLSTAGYAYSAYTSYTSSYLTKMKDYYNSTVASLLWRTFDSLSFSLSQVQISVVGWSDYEKDWRALGRRSTAGKGRKRKKQSPYRGQYQQPLHRQLKKRKNRVLPAQPRRHSADRYPLHPHAAPSIHPMPPRHPLDQAPQILPLRQLSVPSSSLRGKSAGVGTAGSGMKGRHRRGQTMGGAASNRHTIGGSRAELRGMKDDEIGVSGMRGSRGHRKTNSFNNVGWGATTTRIFENPIALEENFGYGSSFHSLVEKFPSDHIGGNNENIEMDDDDPDFGGGCWYGNDEEEEEDDHWEEDESIWSKEGQVEVGFTVDKLVVSPGSFAHGPWKKSATTRTKKGSVSDGGSVGVQSVHSKEGDGLTSGWGPSALKRLRCRGLGLFLRRKNFPRCSDDEDGHDAPTRDLRTEKTMFWNDLLDDDYIFNTNMEAHLRVFRNAPSSLDVASGSTVGTTASSADDEGDTSRDVYSDSVSTTNISQGTRSRRGKRERRPKRNASKEEGYADYGGDWSTSSMTGVGNVKHITQNLLPPTAQIHEQRRPRSSSFLKQSKSSSTSPITMTTGFHTGVVGAGSATTSTLHTLQSLRATSPTSGPSTVSTSRHGNPCSRPNQLETHLKMGHIRSTLSSRQLFLLHSLSSSLERRKRGRPFITIRAAKEYDHIVLERMVRMADMTDILALRGFPDEITGCKDHIFSGNKFFPIMEMGSKYVTGDGAGACNSRFESDMKQMSRRSSFRTLPLVVAAWWKYAFHHITIELKKRESILAQVDEEGDRPRRRKSSFLFSFNDRWNWARQSRIRREYIELYLAMHRSSLGLTAENAAAESAATKAEVTAAKMRLSELEDELTVERILLLKNVARAATVRCVENSVTPTSSPADSYYTFPSMHSTNEAKTAKSSHPIRRQRQETIFADARDTVGDSSLPPVEKTSKLHPASSLSYEMRATSSGATVRSARSRKSVIAGTKSSKYVTPSVATKEDATFVSNADEFSLQRGNLENQPFSFSIVLQLAGVSFAIVDASEDHPSMNSGGLHANYEYSDYDNYGYEQDDISALTGFSTDAEDLSTLNNEASKSLLADAFEPMSQFWPTVRHGFLHEALVVIHMADIRFAAKSATHGVGEVNFRTPPENNLTFDFSLGGIGVQGDGMLPSQKILFTLGHIPGWDTTGAELDHPLYIASFSESKSHTPGIGGVGNLGSVMSIVANIGSSRASIDWEWLEDILVLAAGTKDVEPSSLLSKLERQLFVKAWPSHNETESTTKSLIEIEFSKMSINIPVQISSVEGAEQFLLTSVNSLLVQTGDHREDSFLENIASPNSWHGKTRCRISSIDAMCPEMTENSGCQIVVCDGFNAILVTKDSEKSSTRRNVHLLRNSISLQAQYYPGQAFNQDDSLAIRSSPTNLLLSEFRLRTIGHLLENVSRMTSLLEHNSEECEHTVSYFSSLSEIVLMESNVTLSLGFHVVEDMEEENDASGDTDENFELQDQLKQIIANFISHVSCFDVRYPNQNAINCMARISHDQCCALGISKREAKLCIEAAQTNFTKEAKPIFESLLRDSDLKSSKTEPRNSTNQNRETRMSAQMLSDVIQEIIERATETTFNEFQDIAHTHTCIGNSNIPEIHVQINTCSFSQSTTFGGGNTLVKANSFEVRNGSGVCMLKILPRTCEEEKEDTFSLHQQNVIGHNNTALEISLNEHILDGHARCEKNIHFEAEKMDIVFVAEAYAEAIKLCDSLTKGFSSSKDDSKMTTPPAITQDIVTKGDIASFSIILTDKLIPFVSCDFDDLSVEISSLQSKTITETRISSSKFAVECVSPTGAETYPCIISTYPSQSYAIAVSMSDKQDSSVTLSGVKILVLRQFINEVMQFMSSPLYGIGLFKSLTQADNIGDEEGSSSPLKISILDSSIVFPRGSKSIDLVALEVEEALLSLLLVAESWSIDSYSFSDDAKDSKGSNNDRNGPPRSSTMTTTDDFFDCIDDVKLVASPEVNKRTLNCSDMAGFGNSNSSTGMSRDDSPKIPRVSLDLKCARMFTALNNHGFSSDKFHMSMWNSHTRSNGRPHRNKPAFISPRSLNKAMTAEIKARIWEEITCEPLRLKITMDTIDDLQRLLIEENPRESGDSTRLALAMRMSQFYLLLSVWYDNCQELPLMFEYDRDFIEKWSSSAPPPSDWPEYGTEEFVKRLKSSNAMVTSEIAMCFNSFHIKCLFDSPGYFDKDPPTAEMMGGLFNGETTDSHISLSFGKAICSLKSNEDSVFKVAMGAALFKILDGRKSNNEAFSQAASVGTEENAKILKSFADASWGLDCGRHTLTNGLPLPFQLSVFMTPDNWCMVNLGADLLDAHLADLSPIWILLDYFGLYFKQAEYGHPAFVADQLVKETVNGFDSIVEDVECLNMDFRLWLTKPHVVMPSGDHDDLCIMVEAMSGISYRYRSVGLNFSSQEIVAKDLGIVVLRHFMEPSISRGLRHVSGSLSNCGVKTILDGLSFFIKYDYHESTNFTHFAVRIPLSNHHFENASMDGIEGPEIELKPFCVPPPLVCKPFVSPSRNIGHHETAIYFSYDYMKLASTLFMNFVGSNAESAGDDESSRKHATNVDFDGETNSNPSAESNSFSVTARVERIQFIISDPVMGMNRPILSICVPSLLLTASQLQESGPDCQEEATGFGESSVIPKYHGHPNDLQASVETTVFVDYFKLGPTRSWEPLLEPFRCLILYEKSAHRGKGLTFNSDCPFHVNITGSLIETLDDAIDTFQNFWSGKDSGTPTLARRSSSVVSQFKESIVTSQTTQSGQSLSLYHSPAEQIEESERISFSILNQTGEKVRYHTHSSMDVDLSKTTVFYLHHHQTAPLTFQATISVTKNLTSIEAPFIGDLNKSFRGDGRKMANMNVDHLIDVQVPGFQWVRGVSMDETGRQFVELIPRSLLLQAKVSADWRLKNALHILAELNAINGGRRLTLRAPFEIVNKTEHTLELAVNPDPRRSPQNDLGCIDEISDSDIDSEENTLFCSAGDFSSEKIEPNETYSVSFLLLESALRLNGKHLGSIWIRPDQEVSHGDVFGPDMSTHHGSSQVGYSSRPIQLAKVLHESSSIFNESNGDASVANNIASGLEVSCPIYDKCNSRKSVPFCYVVEVNRSPLVRSSQAEVVKVETNGADALSPFRFGKGAKNAKSMFTKTTPTANAEVHAPVMYSLIVHPPIILENMLPERGRFELMNASTRSVVWWGSLEPGERIPIHTVGLDAPLLLFVNLGFCRTSVGEGALVHHGGESIFWKAGLNTIGSAMKTSKDKVKKTLYTMAESQGNRGAGRLQALRNGASTPKAADSPRVTQLGFSSENEGAEASDGGQSRGVSFGAEDVAREISVIDSLGQRLNLNIDNQMGNGGQRRISLFCPFWIINTTEHCLHYKQEKTQHFVSGTVLSQEKDGSKPVDGSNRNDVIEDEDAGNSFFQGGILRTIYSGTPGALSGHALEPAVLTALIGEDLPLSVLSRLAFMFNFQDVISLGGPPKLCIQLVDTVHGKFASSWSSGFGVESVGVTQIVGMRCNDGRALEVSVSISVAPGRLSSYTKIVRICPRYVIVNQLPRPIRIWQDNSLLHPNVAVEHSIENDNESQKWVYEEDENLQENASLGQYQYLFEGHSVIDSSTGSDDSSTNAHHAACYIATIPPKELVTFHLPDTRADRLFRIDYGPHWSLSPSFPSDVADEHSLTIHHARDLRILPHVSTRAAPVYTVSLPPPSDDWNGELGVWFETEWGKERTLIVKGTKENSYASFYTDIVVGDELIFIDNTPVKQFKFDEAMKYLKGRLAAAKEAGDSRPNQLTSLSRQLINKTKRGIGRSSTLTNLSSPNNQVALTLTFLTLEERMKRLRRHAVGGQHSVAGLKESTRRMDNVENQSLSKLSSQELMIDMKFLFQSMFIFVRKADPSNPPHKIINRSLCWTIFYRQKACDSHPWSCLSPGEAASYTWEEPTKPKKLSVRVGVTKLLEPGFGQKGHQTEEDSLWKSNKSQFNAKRKKMFSFQFVESEEQGHFGAPKTVKLKEIGFSDWLPCPSKADKGGKRSDIRTESSLHACVDTEGVTRVLVISDGGSDANTDGETLVRSHLNHIRKEIFDEDKRRAKVELLKKFVAASADGAPDDLSDISGEVKHGGTHGPIFSVAEHWEESEDEVDSIDSKNISNYPLNLTDATAVEQELQNIFDDYPEGQFITKRNQIVVEVLEATGLKPSNLNGFSNPYCKVSLTCGKSKTRTGSFKSKATRSTYFVEKSLSPQWSLQAFVFNVPAKASYDPRETRRHSVQCVVNSFEKLGKDKFLGQVQVHLRNLKNQGEHEGWYPLMGKLGQREIGKDSMDRIRGSVRLRVQWVHDLSGLIDYYCLCSDRRLKTLRKSKSGLQKQLRTLQATSKEMKEASESTFSGVPSLPRLFKKKKSVIVSANSDQSANNRTKVGDENPTHPNKRVQNGRGQENKLMRSLHMARDMVVHRRRKQKDPRTSENFSSAFDDDFMGSDYFEDLDSFGSYEQHEETNLGDVESEFLNRVRTFSQGDSPGQGDLDRTVPSQNASQLARKSTLTSSFIANNAAIVRLRQTCLEDRHNLHDSTKSGAPPLTSWNMSRSITRASSIKSPMPNCTSSKSWKEKHGDESDFSPIFNFLTLPPSLPRIIEERENNHLSRLVMSRASFSKAARRSLRSVVNPGGLLIIRPMTALNLPDTFNGMYVKLRYGPIVLVSETVESKVAPVWTHDESLESTVGSRPINKRKRGTVITRDSLVDDGIADFTDIAEMINPTWAWNRPRKNDLLIEVDPFDSSKSLRLSVIGDRLQSKVELGVLEIPLGPALECCAQSLEDFEEDRARSKPKGLAPAYVRWFPLMSPSESIPVEGDMGQSFRPQESEKLNDNMFEEYFAPCIKLAFMFKPDVDVDVDSGFSDSVTTLSTDQYMYARLDRISAALIDSFRTVELLSFSSRDADLRISVTKAKTRLAVAVGHIQLDQQSVSLNTKAPVVLAPTPVKHPQATIQFLCWKNNIRSKNDISSYDIVALQVQELDLKIEESWLFDVWEFYMDVMKKREARSRSHHHATNNTFTNQTGSNDFAFSRHNNCELAVNNAAAFLEKCEDNKKMKKVYVRELVLGYTKVNLSYFKSGKGTWGTPESSENGVLDIGSSLDMYSSPMLLSRTCPVQSDAEAYRQWSENMTQSNGDEGSNHININIISVVFPSISEAPIRFQRKAIEHVFESEGDIWGPIQSYYAAETLRQLYKILGSLDFVGNPTMVLSSFATGLRDFFLQPSLEIKNIAKNPSRVGVGVLKGTLSLFSNSAGGIFGFASNLGASFGHLSATLTLDDQFQRIHAEKKAAQQRHYDRWKKKGLGHVTLMVSRPFHDIVFGILSGSTGLLTEPYRGAKNSGAVGFTRGAAIGVIGVVVKPIVGLSDAFSHVMESIHDIAKSVNILEVKYKQIERYRLPYVFGAKKILLPFNQVDSRSAQLLMSFPLDKRFKKGEEIVVQSEALHMGHGVDQYVVVSTKRVALFKLKAVEGQGFIEVGIVWQIRFEKGFKVTSSLGNRGHNGTILCISRFNAKSAEQLEKTDNSTFSSNEKDLDDFSRRKKSNLEQSCDSETGRTSINAETPRASFPTNPKGAAFKIRAWPFTNVEVEGETRFFVEGEFSQRSQLLKIHNAVCCMSNDFESIIYEGVAHGRSEGVTSFGQLTFEPSPERREKPTGSSVQDLTYLYSSLESSPWICNGLKEENPLFEDILQASKYDEAPYWLVNSRARGMFVPVPPPSLPSNIDLSQDGFVSQVLSELECGLRSSENAEQEIYTYARSQNFKKIQTDLMKSAVFQHNDISEAGSGNSSRVLKPIPSQANLSLSSIPSVLSYNESLEPGLQCATEKNVSKDSSGSVSTICALETSIALAPTEGDNLDEMVCLVEKPKIQMKQSTALDAPFLSTTGSQSIHSRSLTAEREPGLDERLCRVEAMLKQLVPHAPTQNELPLVPASNISVSQSKVGIFTPNNQTKTVDSPSLAPLGSSRDSEIEALQREISDLKKQLAAKNSELIEQNDTKNSFSQGSLSNENKKNHKRMKRIFHGRKKHKI